METVAQWAKAHLSRNVLACNVHMTVTANRNSDLRRAVDGADLVMPDGMPLVWVLRRNGFPGQERISGPDLMWRLCAQAEKQDLRVLFYGSTPETLNLLQNRLMSSFPKLVVAGMISPPFRSLSEPEDTAMVESINLAGPQIVFVGLGCPKQEIWMDQHRERIKAVMVGVGAAFDFHAGTLNRAPAVFRDLGLEWAFRLWQEPRRLFSRYLITNSIFLWHWIRRTLCRVS